MATKGVKESDALYNDKIYPAVSRLYETERYEPFIALSDLRFHFLRLKLNLYKIFKALNVFCILLQVRVNPQISTFCREFLSYYI
jgi:hypothetical protein